MFSGSTVVIRPRSHWSRFWKLDRTEIGLARNFFFFEMDPRATYNALIWNKLAGDFMISYSDLLLIDETKGEIWSNPILYPPWLPVRNVTAFNVLFSSTCITLKYCFHVSKEFANMFRRSLFQAFGQDKENYECNDIQTKWTFCYIIDG